MIVADFIALRQRLGLTRAGMARALGIHRNTIQAYEQGDRPIPLTVALACAALAWGLPPYSRNR